MANRVTNPFESADGEYFVLVNHEDQHSLWPAWIDVPPGWTVTYGPDERRACLDHVERVWTDITPRSRRAEDAA
ncbi:MbtH family protein [Streptomyces sp. CT34]|uniref:MbtH family protein n=1 Tax=Streptomyces sp. CT34 TaxID=1553907 RepID=UPI0005BDFA96|nr:MbtH family protein [Streptomyces sp. CT34]